MQIRAFPQLSHQDKMLAVTHLGFSSYKRDTSGHFLGLMSISSPFSGKKTWYFWPEVGPQFVAIFIATNKGIQSQIVIFN